MTTAWLFLTLAMTAVAWVAIWARHDSEWRVRSALMVPCCAVLAWHFLTVPLGKPASTPPAGEYTVLGARIDVPTDTSAGAIYVLLDGVAEAAEESVPRYYVLPYSTQQANALQSAMDSGNGAMMEANENGEPDFYEPPVQADTPKQPERPAITIGE